MEIIITILIKILFVSARSSIRMLPKIILKIRKSSSKLYHRVFHSSEQETLVLISIGTLAGEDAIARRVKPTDEFVRDLDKVEVLELTALRESFLDLPITEFINT